MRRTEASSSLGASSDPTAEKLANNAEQPAAEPVEPRAEAEGNANQQSTDRTQRRQDVSQALARIRRVARQRKKDKFTALFHHLSTDLLEQAFSDLNENAAPGVDRLTWKDYEAKLESNLENLHSRIHRGAYRHCHRVEFTFLNPTAGNARLQLRPWKTRLFNGPQQRC